MFDTTAGMSGSTGRHMVLRNTYSLLSMTLVFSAVTAFIGMRYPVHGWGMLGIMLLAFALLFATKAYRNSPMGVLLVFGFTGLMGYTLGPTLNHYLSMEGGSQTVGIALFTTGAVFLGLSSYVHVTKRDFGFLGGLLFAGLIGLIVVSLLGMFFHVAGLQLALAYFSALLFSGYILHDTSEITTGRQTNYIMATIGLYLNILNLFTSLLRISSSLRS